MINNSNFTVCYSNIFKYAFKFSIIIFLQCLLFGCKPNDTIGFSSRNADDALSVLVNSPPSIKDVERYCDAMVYSSGYTEKEYLLAKQVAKELMKVNGNLELRLVKALNVPKTRPIALYILMLWDIQSILNKINKFKIQSNWRKQIDKALKDTPIDGIRAYFSKRDRMAATFINTAEIDILQKTNRSEPEGDNADLKGN